jgi:hypothetical protein
MLSAELLRQRASMSFPSSSRPIYTHSPLDLAQRAATHSPCEGYRSQLIFVQLVLVLYHFCTSSVLSYSCFRIPIVLFSNGN